MGIEKLTSQQVDSSTIWASKRSAPNTHKYSATNKKRAGRCESAPVFVTISLLKCGGSARCVPIHFGNPSQLLKSYIIYKFGRNLRYSFGLGESKVVLIWLGVGYMVLIRPVVPVIFLCVAMILYGSIL